MRKRIISIGLSSDLYEALKVKLKDYGIGIDFRSSIKEVLEPRKKIASEVLVIETPIQGTSTETVIEKLQQCPLSQSILITELEEQHLAELAFERNYIFDYFLRPISDVQKLTRTILRAFDLKNAQSNSQVLGPHVVESTFTHDDSKLSKQSDTSKLTVSERQPSKTFVQILNSVFNNIMAPLIILDRELRIRAINQSALSCFNIKEKSTATGNLCYATLRHRKEPCRNCPVLTALATGKPVSLQNYDQLNDIWEKISVHPIKLRNRVVFILVQIHEISKAQDIEKRVEQTEKLASLGFLASSIAHEINSPNNLITFNIPILRDYVSELFDVVEEASFNLENIFIAGRPYLEIKRDIFTILDSIQHGSERIKIIVSELSRFIRETDEKWERSISIKKVVDRALTICGNKVRRSVKNFEVKVDEDLPIIEANPGVLEQILINLLVNASQSIDKEDSWIKLNVETKEKQHSKELHVEVSDNGCGIDESMLDRIFEPFFTTKPVGHGTGLGLSICKTLAEYLGGRIEVESAPGRGSTFRFILPLKSPKIKQG